jgi:uncharacterized protein YraI
MAGSLVPCAALAATLAVATADLNIRSGPGPEYPVIGVIGLNGEATIDSCIQDSRWCQITYRGQPGWVYTQYMQVIGRSAAAPATVIERAPATVVQPATRFNVPTVVYERRATVGMGPVAVTGAILDSVADTAAAATGVISPPPPAVRTYVVEHPVDPVYLDGEVVVGAGLPESVELQPVPDSDYEYGYVNRQPVLVEPRTRRIVYVYR